MGRLKNLFIQIIRTHSPESSKRFVALWAMLLVSYVVIRFTSHSNIEAVLGTLAAFVLALLGVAAWEKIKAKEKEDNKN